jgi:hypothetical protein
VEDGGGIWRGGKRRRKEDSGEVWRGRKRRKDIEERKKEKQG